MCYIAVKAAD